MMNHRMLPPVAVDQQTRTVNGRTYTGTPGSAIDVADFDAEMLAANGWLDLGPSGPTSARPTGTLPPYAAVPGASFIDTTLSKPIWFDGATWRDMAGNAV